MKGSRELAAALAIVDHSLGTETVTGVVMRCKDQQTCKTALTWPPYLGGKELSCDIARASKWTTQQDWSASSVHLERGVDEKSMEVILMQKMLERRR